MKKHLQSIAILSDKKENDKIAAYIEQLMRSSDLKESARLCDHEMLNAILCGYKRKCDSSRKANTPLIVITVVNSSRTNPFAGSQRNLPTTKPDKRGHDFGLKSIRKTIGNYHGDMQMYYNEDTLTFHTVIILKLKHH